MTSRLIKEIERMNDAYSIAQINHKEEKFEVEVKDHILNIIKKYRLIITGRSFFRDHDLFSEGYTIYEVFSGSNGIKICVELANALFNDNSKYVQVRQVNAYTFTVSIEFINYFILTSLKDNTFKNLPVIHKNGSKYLHPDLFKANIYKVLCNPRMQIIQWKKNFDDLITLNEHFPDKFKLKNITERTPDDHYKVMKKIINEVLRNNKDVIAIGNYAYYELMRRSDAKKYYIPALRTLEVLSSNPDNTLKKVKKILGNIQVKKSQSDFHMYKTKFSIFKDKKRIMVIYDISHQCVPFSTLNEIRFGSYHLILYYIYVGIWIGHMTKNNDLLNKLKSMIYWLTVSRTKYLRKRGLNGTEPSPFKIFHLECQGSEENVTREHKIKKWKKQTKRPFAYSPDQYYKKHNKLLQF